MQFTGLSDKNGKEIYEGYILGWPEKLPKGWTGKYQYEVIFDNGAFIMKSFGQMDQRYEVIGNIY